MSAQALSGVKVVEWGEFISAPYCAKMLADMGAEVIKVEEPGSGDEARRYGPFPNDIPHPERSGLFLYLNTNKLGITLNPRLATGRAILKELLKEADIFVENRPPRLVEELGLDYASLSQVNRRLIVTSITPYGRTGPYRDYKGYDLNIQMAGGSGGVLGNLGREPLGFPGDQGHYQGAISAASATMVALLAQRRDGLGQQVDISESEVIATLQRGYGPTNFVYRGVVAKRLGHRSSGLMWPYGVFPCKDGYVIILTMEDYHWKWFVEAMGNPEWAFDPRWKDAGSFGRVKYADELEAHLIGWLMDHTKDEVMELAQSHGCPFMKVNTAEAGLESLHLKAREYFVAVEHPEVGTLSYAGAPVKLSQTPWRVVRRAPLLGEHNEAILCGRLGYSREYLAELRRAGVI